MAARQGPRDPIRDAELQQRAARTRRIIAPMRRYLCVAAFLAAVVALAACGGGEDSAPPAETPAVAADPPPAPEPAPPAPEPAPEPEPPAEPEPEPAPEPTALTKDEYIVEADALYAELNARTEALGEPETVEEIVAWAAGFGEIAVDGVPRLQALEPPADDRAGADAIMANLFDQVDFVTELGAAAEAGDAEAIDAIIAQVAEISAESDRTARAYGFRECGVDDDAEPTGAEPAGASPGQDSGDMQLIYVPSENELLQGTIDAIAESGVLDALVEGINDTLALPRDIQVFVEEETPGPAYFPDFNEIVMPPEFVDLVFTVFEESGLVEGFEDTRDLTLATLAFVFMHEVGHALTAELDLPITGREEDAADQLATVIVTSAGEDAGGIAIAAATLFGLFGADREQFEEADFWDEHSLDEQRFFNILCWVFGSDPAAYADIVFDSGIGEDRLVRCEGEWEQISSSWETLLAPHVK